MMIRWGIKLAIPGFAVQWVCHWTTDPSICWQMETVKLHVRSIVTDPWHTLKYSHLISVFNNLQVQLSNMGIHSGDRGQIVQFQILSCTIYIIVLRLCNTILQLGCYILCLALCRGQGVLRSLYDTLPDNKRVSVAIVHLGNQLAGSDKLLSK